jgi:MFS transporter, FHS family, Na+ dependent glucose transporter 1
MDQSAAKSSPQTAAAASRLPITAAYYAAFVGLGLVAAILGPTLLGLAEHTGSSLRAISYLFTARSLGYLIGSFAGGRLYDHVPGHRLMGGGLLVLAATLLLAPLMPLLPLLVFVMLCLGVAEGSVDIGGNTLLVWVHRERVGPFMNGLHFFFGLGAFLSPIVIAQVLLMTGGIQWSYWLLALIVLPMAVWLLRIPSPARQPAAAAGEAGEANWLLVGLIAVFFFLYVGAEVSAGGWIATYAQQTKLASAAVAAYLTSLFWGGFTAARLLSIPIAARINPHTVLFVELFICLAGVAVILLWPASLVALIIGTTGLGLGMAAIFPTTLLVAGRHMKITGRINAWFFVGSSTGPMFWPWLIGQLFDAHGPHMVMVVLAVALALALAAFTALAFYVRRISAGEHGVH